jgi:lipid-A-disaccharide synthase-like uncharacterized protein
MIDTAQQFDRWILLGFGAQFLFSMRFLIQWIATEKKRASVIPEAFWYFSIAGACGLLVYAIHIKDPVFILGQSMGILIYSRNLMFIHRNKRS